MDTLHEKSGTFIEERPVTPSTPTHRISFFNNKNDNSPKHESFTWPELCECLKERDLRNEKDGPLFSGAIYPPASTRCNENVKSISVVILDFDEGIGLEDIKKYCSRLNHGSGVAAVIYSTHRHTTEKPKLRLVMPLLVPVSGNQWLGVCPRVFLAFGGKPDSSAKDAARMHYLPSCPEERAGEACFLIIEGAPLDVATLPEVEPDVEPDVEAEKTLPVEEKVLAAKAAALRPPHDAYAYKAFQNEVERVRNAVNGKRNSTLNNAALSLGHFSGAGRLKRSEVQDGLLKAGREAGLEEDEILPTINSGLSKGETEPNYKGMAPYAVSDVEQNESQARLLSSDIPYPARHTGRGKQEYENSQLVKLIRPAWDGVSLDSHAANAARFRDYLGQDLRFCPQLGWLRYNGWHWERDDRDSTITIHETKILSKIVQEEATQLYELSVLLAKDGRHICAAAMGRAAISHSNHAAKVENKNFIESTIKLAAGFPEIRVAPEVFDPKPWVVTFKNGVWDKGIWRQPERDDFCLNICPVEIDLGVDQSEWLSVLNCKTGSNKELQHTLQDVAGYGLSGASNLRTILWPYGPKGTGKSTFSELLLTSLGKTAAMIDPKSLQASSERERLGARLWNKRVAVCGEAGSQKLEPELLKTLSGGDTLTVRHLYNEAFDAKPTHVLVMVSNDAPDLDAYDEALKDRVMALPFLHPLAGEGQIPLTGGARIETVRKDPSSPLVRGFSAWAVEGMARLYQTQEIYRAPCIETATQQFWADTDPLTPFWEEIAEERLRAGISSRELQDECDIFCMAEDIKPVRARNFGKACKSRGLEQTYQGSGKNRRRVWILRGKQEQNLSTAENEQDMRQTPQNDAEFQQHCSFRNENTSCSVDEMAAQLGI